MSRRACYTLPGSGTLLAVLSGALEELLPVLPPSAIGGTSGGGLVALGIASGMRAAQVSELAVRMTQRRDLLDKGWPLDQSPGLFRGRKIEELLRDAFGERRMDDLIIPARVTAWDAWTRRPVVVCSMAHPDVAVWRAARATMAIQGFFDLARLRTDNARTYGDGGLVLNVPHGLWDDRLDVTVGLRFAHQARAFTVQGLIASAEGGAHAEDVQPVRSWADLARAAASSVLSLGSSSWPSDKGARFFEVAIDAGDADGLAFGLSAKEAVARREQGIRQGFLARTALRAFRAATEA